MSYFVNRIDGTKEVRWTCADCKSPFLPQDDASSRIRLRDEFAKSAISGFCSSEAPHDMDVEKLPAAIAVMGYLIADAMLLERDKKS